MTKRVPKSSTTWPNWSASGTTIRGRSDTLLFVREVVPVFRATNPKKFHSDFSGAFDSIREGRPLPGGTGPLPPPVLDGMKRGEIYVALSGKQLSRYAKGGTPFDLERESRLLEIALGVRITSISLVIVKRPNGAPLTTANRIIAFKIQLDQQAISALVTRPGNH